MAAGKEELWLDCVNWLGASGVLEEAGTPPPTTPATLAAALRDGVILCELALRLSPGCIERHRMYFQSTQNRKSQFMCSNNIALFLGACQRTFGLTRLFRGTDLYELEDFGRVLQLLSDLSHTQQARQVGMRTFPSQGRGEYSSSNGGGSTAIGSTPAPTTTSTTTATADEIYCNLREQVEMAPNASSPSSLRDDSHYDFIGGNYGPNVQKREQIYDSILALRRSELKPVSKRYAEFKPSNEREFCIKELLDTESNYCDTLSIIVENFYNRLSSRLDEEDMAIIFINIRDLHQLHRSFLLRLSPAVLASLGIRDREEGEGGGGEAAPQPQQQEKIADIFIRFKMQFVAYAKYCALLRNSLARIEELERTEPDIKRVFIDLCRAAHTNQFKLQDHLVVPMQRILKYPLLLKQLHKTSPSTEEQAELDLAFDAMNDLSNYVNEAKRDSEMIDVLQTIQRSVRFNVPILNGGGDTLTTQQQQLSQRNFSSYGRLLQDGMVELKEGSGKAKPRYVFLFELCLMVCKQKGNSLFEWKQTHLLSNYELMDNELNSSPHKSSTLARKLTAGLFDNVTITLIRKGWIRGGGADTLPLASSTSTALSNASLQLQLRSLQQRNEWRAMLKNALEINTPSAAIAKGHLLLYKTYTTATACSVCSKLLAGKMYQGYSCSGCQRQMHRECARIVHCTRRSNIGNGTGRLNRSISAVSTSSVMVTAIPPHQFSLDRMMEPPPSAVPPPPPTSDPPIATVNANGRRSSQMSRSSITSLSDASPNGNGSTRPLSQSLVSNEVIVMSLEGKVSDLHQQPWYFGQIEREEANQLLDRTEDGTFIVRRSQHQQREVISLRYEGKCKHMKVEWCTDRERYYLHEGRLFESILDLVNFYRDVNLSEGFTNLDTTLKGTILKGTVFRVLHQFQGRDDVKYLSLVPGERVTVVDTLGEENGWWKGMMRGRVGFFPLRFVARISDPNMDALDCYTLTTTTTSTATPSINSSTTMDGGNGNEYGQPERMASLSPGLPLAPQEEEEEEEAEAVVEELGNITLSPSTSLPATMAPALRGESTAC